MRVDLPAAILAHQRHNLMAVEGEINFVQRHHPREAAAQAGDAEQRSIKSIQLIQSRWQVGDCFV